MGCTTEPVDCAGVVGGSAVEDCAGVCGGGGVNCLDWEYNPGAYEFTSWIVGGIVLYDDVQMGDGGDLLAAFDDAGNVRGVGVQLNPPFGPYEGTTVWEVTMGSNAHGDLISFRYYDASVNEILYISTTYSFAQYEQLGDVMNPYELIITSNSILLD